MTLDQGKVGQVYTVTRVGRAGGGPTAAVGLWRSAGNGGGDHPAAPLGDPVELRLRGYTLTLRRADGAQVTVEPGRQLRREEGRDWIW